MSLCNICHGKEAKYYGNDPYEPGYEYWYCDNCVKFVITPDGPVKEVAKK